MDGATIEVELQAVVTKSTAKARTWIDFTQQLVTHPTGIGQNPPQICLVSSQQGSSGDEDTAQSEGKAATLLNMLRHGLELWEPGQPQ